MLETAYEFIKKTDRLPSPDGVALELLRLAESPDSTLRAITAVVEADPATAGRILKAANSSLLAPPHPVTCIREAVSQLGLRTVQLLALGFSLVRSPRDHDLFDYEAFWGDSLARAVAARRLATAVGGVNHPLEMFTCGLLSQVGRLAFATVYPQTYATVLEETRGKDAEAVAAEERSVFDLDHEELTVAMFEDWGLPESFRLAVAAQRDPEASALRQDTEAFAIARLMHLVGRIVPIVTRRKVDCDEISEMVRIASACGLAPDVFPAKFDAISEEWRALGAVFEVTTHPVPTLAELYTQAANARAGLEDGRRASEAAALTSQ